MDILIKVFLIAKNNTQLNRNSHSICLQIIIYVDYSGHSVLLYSKFLGVSDSSLWGICFSSDFDLAALFWTHNITFPFFTSRAKQVTWISLWKVGRKCGMCSLGLQSYKVTYWSQGTRSSYFLRAERRKPKPPQKYSDKNSKSKVEYEQLSLEKRNF